MIVRTLVLTAAAAVLCPLLVSVGMANLGEADRPRVRLQMACVVLGGLWGLATVNLALRTNGWVLALAVLLWGSAVVAAAACDAVTQRVPSSLVRTAFLGTGAALGTALVLRGDLRALAMTGIGAAAAGLTLLAYWRFAGAGFGDVRLAALGGLGMGHARVSGMLLGLAAALIVTVGQAALVMSRGGDRHTLMPLGPALAVGFLIAATA